MRQPMSSFCRYLSQVEINYTQAIVGPLYMVYVLSTEFVFQALYCEYKWGGGGVWGAV